MREEEILGQADDDAQQRAPDGGGGTVGPLERSLKEAVGADRSDGDRRQEEGVGHVRGETRRRDHLVPHLERQVTEAKRHEREANEVGTNVLQLDTGHLRRWGQIRGGPNGDQVADGQQGREPWPEVCRAGDATGHRPMGRDESDVEREQWRVERLVEEAERREGAHIERRQQANPPRHGHPHGKPGSAEVGDQQGDGGGEAR